MSTDKLISSTQGSIAAVISNIPMPYEHSIHQRRAQSEGLFTFKYVIKKMKGITLSKSFFALNCAEATEMFSEWRDKQKFDIILVKQKEEELV